VRILKRLAAPLIRFSMRRVNLLLLFAWLLAIYCGWRLTTFGADFLPAFNEGAAQLSVLLPAGSSLEANVETSQTIDAKLKSLCRTKENPKAPLRSFVRKTGRAELDEHADPPNASDIILQLNPESGESRGEALARIKAEVEAEAPGIQTEIEQPLAHLISENI